MKTNYKVTTQFIYTSCIICITVLLIFNACDLIVDKNYNRLPVFQTRQTEFTDDELLDAVYSDYKYPEYFYTEDFDGGSPYYENTVSITPLEDRTNEWRELCTNSREQALEWSELSSQYSSYYRDLVEESETDKYFQFRRVWLEHPSDILLSRVHKCMYLDRSNYDRFKGGHLIGTFNYRPVSAAAVAELVEYLWFIGNYNTGGFKALSSFTDPTDEYIRHTIYAIRVSYGDWGLCDYISLVKEIYDVHTVTGDISYYEVYIRSIQGKCR